MTITPKTPPSRLRMTILVAAILLVGFIAANTLSFFASRDSIRNSVLQNELPLISDNIYSAIQSDLLVPVFIAGLMANDTFLRDWMLAGENDSEAVTRYLETIRETYGVFTAFLISEETRNYYHFTGISRKVTDPEKDDWYFRNRAMSEPFEINVDHNQEQDNKLTVFVNHRVLDYDGNFLGVTGVGLDFDTVAEAISRYEKEFGRSLYFVNKAGMIEVRSKDAAIREDFITNAVGVGAVADGILSGKADAVTYERDGQTYLLSSRFVPELGWHVLVEQREADRVAGIRHSFVTSTLLGLATTIFMVLIVSYAIRMYESKLQSLAITDGLTGIGNRRAFDMSLEQTLKRAARDASKFSILLFDIDHFKRVNDELGHIAGDSVIRDVTNLIGGHIREADVFCRWGGEEFIVLAHNCGFDEAVELAEKIRGAVEDAAVARHKDGSAVTISGGVTSYYEGDDVNTILGRADKALYAAKAAGRNCVRSEE